MHLKDNLRSLLKKHDMTVAQLSRKANTPAQNIHNWLNGLKAKDIEQVKRVARVFSVSLDYLIFGEKVLDNAELSDEVLAGTWEVILRKPKGENT